MVTKIETKNKHKKLNKIIKQTKKNESDILYLKKALKNKRLKKFFK